MNTAVYPTLTEQVARNDLHNLLRTYQRSCEWMAAIIIPPALLLAFFAGPVLMAWTGDARLAKSVATLLALLSLGTLLNGLMNLPYMLQLAHGWTGLSIRVNIVAVAIIVPAIIWTVPRYGASAAGYAWLLLNACYLVLTAQLMHRRILPAAKWPWYRDAIIAPLVAGALTGAALLAVLPRPFSRIAAASTVSLAGLFLTVAVVCALPNVRKRLVMVLSATFRVRIR
jgi:O-antigen/teichoic acid export membrane protein